MSQSLLITPSILSANFQKLQEEVGSVELYADWLQVDVMDGHFVPNLSFGAPVAKWIDTKLPLDIHLMVSNPADRIEEFAEIGAKNITFHIEAVTDIQAQRDLVTVIHDKECTAGIALNPGTPLEAIEEILPKVDLVLCMTVQPGFGEQEFIADVLTKIQKLHTAHPDLMIQVDGGIDAVTARQCREAGASNLVSGSYIFRSDDRKEAIASLRG